jgi:hypothetical protein
VHIESVATGRALRPSVARQLIAAHDRAEAGDERLHQAGLDRWQPDPGALVAKHAVDIELRHPSLVLALARRQRRDPRTDVGIGSGNANPVLETVLDRRRRGADFHQQQASRALLLESESTFFFERPTNEHHVHAVEGRHRRFHRCFVVVTAR